jgi:predicted pyridoxine 5'-phosphate oxidase superfamily flavin-nucleotide-binding protein
MSKKPPSDVAFTDAVKEEQRRRGSRAAYERMEKGGGWETTVTDELAEFLSKRDSFYLGTANAEGQPYIQHRGGPPGFVRVVDEHTLGIADYAGNRQYISLGNLGENDRVFLFFMDYAEKRRVKIWARARVVEGDPGLVTRLMPSGYKARAERALLFRVEAWDVNCPQHIPVKFDERDVAAALKSLQDRIRGLQADNDQLKSELCALKPQVNP